MQDIVADLNRWLASEEEFVTATVINTWGSGPRKVGAGMAIRGDGHIIGSVSGGCVEGDVIRQSEKVLKSGENAILHYGVSDDEAWEVGLSCGGKIDILLQRVDQSNAVIWQKLCQNLITNQGCVLAAEIENRDPLIIIAPDDNSGSELSRRAVEAYQKRKSDVYEAESRNYFLNVFPRKSVLLIIGAAHISSELVELAGSLEFETVIIDPRGLFTEKMGFKVRPDQSHQKWPAEILPDFILNSDVYAVLLTHDPKIDDQALHILLKSDVNYIGALGSRKTHAKRVQRLTEAGFSTDEIERIQAPVGIDINASTPREIALSIVSEMVQIRNKYLRS